MKNQSPKTYASSYPILTHRDRISAYHARELELEKILKWPSLFTFLPPPTAYRSQLDSKLSMSFIDDRDPRIKYSGTWIETGGTLDFLGTSIYTDTAGDTAIINFTGTSIGVYGVISALGQGPPSISSYTIDSGVPQQFTTVQKMEKQYQQLFFQASNLDLKQHMLVITNLVDFDSFKLDYFEVGTPAVTTTTSAPSQSSTGGTSRSSTGGTSQSSTGGTTQLSIGGTTQLSTGGNGTVTVTFVGATGWGAIATSSAQAISTPSSSTASTATVNVTSEKRSGPPIGAIVGGAIAGFAIIFLGFYVCLFFSRPQRRYKKTLLSPPTHSTPPSSHPETDSAQRYPLSNITPFIAGESVRWMSQSSSGGVTTYYATQGYANPGWVVPSSEIPFPVGVRQKLPDLPPQYTDVG